MKRKLFIIIGVILVMYIAIINRISSVRIAFSMPITILGIFMIILGFIYNRIIKYINGNITLKRIYKLIKNCIMLICFLLILIEGIIIFYPKHDKTNSDYVLVLGAGLVNGDYPSLTLSYRLDAAIKCVDDYKSNAKIVVSGGQGNNEDISEAEAMKRYLLNHGIKEDRILLEDKSSTTSENFKFSKKVIEQDSKEEIDKVNVKIVTTDFHSFRSRILAKKNGYSNITNYSSKTVWYIAPVNYIREAFAVVKSLVFD